MTTDKWNLFLDDERNPSDVYWMKVDYGSYTWKIARSVDEAISLIEKYGFPDSMSLDHDLGDNFPTGYDFVKWVVNEDMDNPIMNEDAPEVFYHTQNPIGKKNMESLMTSYLSHRYDVSRMSP